MTNYEIIEEASKRTNEIKSMPRYQAGWAGLVCGVLSTQIVAIFLSIANIDKDHLGPQIGITALIVGIPVWLYYRSEWKDYNEEYRYQLENVKNEVKSKVKEA